MTALAEHRVLPLAVPTSSSDAPTLAAGLSAGGINVVEVGLRAPGALEAVSELVADGRLHVGVGTVRTAAQVDAAAEAGAGFLVSPGLSEHVVRRAAAVGLPLVPGVGSASEIMRACELGLHLVKLFPANLLGGLHAIDAFHATFPEVRFVPSGGVSQANLADYLAHPAIAAVSGSWITSGSVLAEGPTSVADLARRAAETVRQVAC
ncbi:MAG: bifunctional 4-hydroxy-2-oxoglutarate aldolase/2-dehydro-3-deoxy-phosphogluconate aldolase [Leucobacter sp.]